MKKNSFIYYGTIYLTFMVILQKEAFIDLYKSTNASLLNVFLT